MHCDQMSAGVNAIRTAWHIDKKQKVPVRWKVTWLHLFLTAKATSVKAPSSSSNYKSSPAKKWMTSVDGSSFCDLGHHMFVDKSASSFAYWDPITMWAELRKAEGVLIAGVNAKSHWSDVIIQIMYPDTDHMLIAGVNGASVSETLEKDRVPAGQST